MLKINEFFKKQVWNFKNKKGGNKEALVENKEEMLTEEKELLIEEKEKNKFDIFFEEVDMELAEGESEKIFTLKDDEKIKLKNVKDMNYIEITKLEDDIFYYQKVEKKEDAYLAFGHGIFYSKENEFFDMYFLSSLKTIKGEDAFTKNYVNCESKKIKCKVFVLKNQEEFFEEEYKMILKKIIDKTNSRLFLLVNGDLLSIIN